MHLPRLTFLLAYALACYGTDSPLNLYTMTDGREIRGIYNEQYQSILIPTGSGVIIGHLRKDKIKSTTQVTLETLQQEASVNSRLEADRHERESEAARQAELDRPLREAREAEQRRAQVTEQKQRNEQAAIDNERWMKLQLEAGKMDAQRRAMELDRIRAEAQVRVAEAQVRAAQAQAQAAQPQMQWVQSALNPNGSWEYIPQRIIVEHR